MNINEMNPINSFLFLCACPNFAPETKMIHMNFKRKLSPSAQRKISDILFILYAGGAALLSYSLVYALRKPFTAATFDGMELFGMDYKIATSIIQIFGYMVSKFIGIKLISN